jgi:hypothetical protein
VPNVVPVPPVKLAIPQPELAAHLSTLATAVAEPEATFDLGPILAQIIPLLLPLIKPFLKQLILAHLDEWLDDLVKAIGAAVPKA